MGFFRGAVFHYGGVPKNCPLALTGRFPSLMGRSPSSMGRFPECLNALLSLSKIPWKNKVAADVWKKNVWEIQAKSGSSGSCPLFLHFLGKTPVQKMSGRTPGSPRHPSSRHPRSSEFKIPIKKRGIKRFLKQWPIVNSKTQPQVKKTLPIYISQSIM